MDTGLRTVLLVVAALAGAVLLLILLGGLFMALMMGAMMTGMVGTCPGCDTIGMWTMLVFALLIMVGIALLMVWAIRRATNMGMRESDRPPGEEPRSILRRRYAAGEISRERYQQMLEELDRSA